eukprot:c19830_g1_i3.p1 GENE.c19830_g1_i3~~c19830_g1_i3.p1  ORF type:complete len:1019 (+),score=228.91 c19830_g1_i3:437-3058(+)
MMAAVFSLVWSSEDESNIQPDSNNTPIEESETLRRASASSAGTASPLFSIERLDLAYLLFVALHNSAVNPVLRTPPETIRALFRLVVQYHMPEVSGHPQADDTLLFHKAMSKVASGLSQVSFSNPYELFQLWDLVVISCRHSTAPSNSGINPSTSNTNTSSLRDASGGNNGPLVLPCLALAHCILEHKWRLGILEYPKTLSRFESYPDRQVVPSNIPGWLDENDNDESSRNNSNSIARYNPPDYTHHLVLENDCHLKEDGWADAVIVSAATLRNTVSHIEPLRIGGTHTQPVPLNPCGRTGLRGRGVLGRWGPNHSACPIITRVESAEDGADNSTDHPTQQRTFVLLALASSITSQSGTSPAISLPSHPRTGGGKVSGAFVQSLLESVTGEDRLTARQNIQTLMTRQQPTDQVIYAGYCDDERNTDHAWREILVVHTHLSQEISATLPLESSHKFDACDAWPQPLSCSVALEWVDVADSRILGLPETHRAWLHQVLALRKGEPFEVVVPEMPLDRIFRISETLTNFPVAVSHRIASVLQHGEPTPGAARGGVCLSELPCVSISCDDAKLDSSLGLLVDVRGELPSDGPRFGVHLDPVEMSGSQVDAVLDQITNMNGSAYAIVCNNDVVVFSNESLPAFDVGDLARARAVIGALHRRRISRIFLVPANREPLQQHSLDHFTSAANKQSAPAILTNLKTLFEKKHDEKPSEIHMPLPPSDAPALLAKTVALGANLKNLFEKKHDDANKPPQPSEQPLMAKATVLGANLKNLFDKKQTEEMSAGTAQSSTSQPTESKANIRFAMKDRMTKASKMFKAETTKLKHKIADLVDGEFGPGSVDPKLKPSAHMTGPRVSAPAYEVSRMRYQTNPPTKKSG